MLVAAAREIGGAQIQNRGTIGGNLANASPAGDTLPVLAAAGARIVLRQRAGTSAPCRWPTFYTGYRASVRRPDELILADRDPPLEGRQWWRKVGTRRGTGDLEGDDGRRAGGRGARGRRRRGAHRRAGRPRVDMLASGASLAEAQAALDAEIAPIDDLRSTRDYRRAVAMNLLAQFWSDTA